MHGAIVDVLKRSYASLWRFSDTGGQFDDRRSLPAPRADIVQLELTVPLEPLGSPHWRLWPCRQYLCCSNPTPGIYCAPGKT
jgi:hypothetical protein